MSYKKTIRHKPPLKSIKSEVLDLDYISVACASLQLYFIFIYNRWDL